MNKALLFPGVLALAVALASCNPQDLSTQFTDTASVVFTLCPDSGELRTKGLAEVLAATLPASIELQVQNTATGVTYTTATGEPINIPVGTYRVTGGNTPEATKNIYGSALYLSHVPKVSVDEEVAVVSGVGAYTLTATYGSVALVVVTGETASWTAVANKDGFSIDAVESGIYKWTFLTGDLRSDRYVHTYLTPTGGGPQRSFTIVGDASLLSSFSDGLVVENGKWYVLHPSDNATQSGGFSVSFQEWTAGN